MPSNAKATKQNKSTTLTLTDPENPNFSVTVNTSSFEDPLQQSQLKATAKNSTLKQPVISRTLPETWEQALLPKRQDSGPLPSSNTNSTLTSPSLSRLNSTDPLEPQIPNTSENMLQNRSTSPFNSGAKYPQRQHSLQTPSNSRAPSIPSLPPSRNPSLSIPTPDNDSFGAQQLNTARRPTDELDSNPEVTDQHSNTRRALTGADDKPKAKAFTRPKGMPASIFNEHSKYLKEAQNMTGKRKRTPSQRAKEAQQQSKPDMRP